MAIDGEQQRQNGDDPSVAIVLFGATGDLAARMVLPAVHTMAARGLLPRDWALIGNGRGEMSHSEFRDHVRQALLDAGDLADADEWQVFSDRLFFAGGGFAIDDPGSLPDVLAEVEEVFGRPPDRLVHYLALPPTTFADITSALGTHDLTADAKVVFEKPFGTSLESFETLNDAVHSVLDEAQIYRIDHFLGKEAAQQLHAARFANRLFAEMWSREHVSAVQIDIPEALDIAGRAEFYDENGALSDMIVTHLFQLAAEVAMEPPVSLGAEDLREARETVISAFRPLDPAEVVLGQFDGYLDRDGVSEGSTTDTFVAARLWVDTDRWRDVPFLLRTGKQLARSAQRVTLVLRPPEQRLFGELDSPHSISFSLAGDGEVEIRVALKSPGEGLTVAPAAMQVHLDDVDGDPLPPYARLLSDVLHGDRALFTRSDGLAAAWSAVARVQSSTTPPEIYAPGSWGPPSATSLAAPDGWLLGPPADSSE